MELLVDSSGQIRCVYSEQLELTKLGVVRISRASYVEPDYRGGWTADLSPLGGPVLGSFPVRSQALAAEVKWLEAHWLTTEPLNRDAQF